MSLGPLAQLVFDEILFVVNQKLKISQNIDGKQGHINL
jgi:hypothetical protein